MKVLLAEDTKDLNHAVTVLLTREGYEVDSFLNGKDAFEAILNTSYDAVILDIMMPGMDGLTVLGGMRERQIMTPVMLLTAKADIDDRVAGLDAGADDYLPKPFAMKELLARVRALIRRGGDYSGEELKFGDLVLSGEDLSLTACNSVRLSIKEYELMKELILGKGRELTTEYLLEHVWKNEDGAGEDTVWLYVSYLKNKLKSVASPVIIEGEKGQAFSLKV